MSWAAHQFEVYLVHAHLPRRMRGGVSFWAVAAGDFLPDFLSKFWVYGVTIGGTHYGASVPHQWHRGWPGMGVTHTVAFGLVVRGAGLAVAAQCAVTVGVALGCVVHVVADIGDTAGVMLLFPFSTASFAPPVGLRRRPRGGKYLDAAAYYSSFGVVADVVWLIATLSRGAALLDHWRTGVPADRLWQRLSTVMPERALLALYRGLFFFGLCRMLAWTLWARVLADRMSSAPSTSPWKDHRGSRVTRSGPCPRGWCCRS